MPRRTALVAGVALALGAAVSTVPAGSAGAVSARPASASAVRVTTSCDGPGTATLIARKTASGGTFAKTRITGLTRRQWIGGTMVTSPATIGDDLLDTLGISDDPDAEPTQPEIKYAKHGSLTESVTSPKAWPHIGAGFYFSAVGVGACIAVVQVRPHGVAAGGADLDVDVRPHDGVVEADAEASDAELTKSDNPTVRVRITVAVTTPSGVQTATRRVRMKDGEAAVRLSHFKALSSYSKVRVTTENLKTHKIKRLTLSRTA